MIKAGWLLLYGAAVHFLFEPLAIVVITNFEFKCLYLPWKTRELQKFCVVTLGTVRGHEKYDLHLGPQWMLKSRGNGLYRSKRCRTSYSTSCHWISQNRDRPSKSNTLGRQQLRCYLLVRKALWMIDLTLLFPLASLWFVYTHGTRQIWSCSSYDWSYKA
jgi:hypothetical protein